MPLKINELAKKAGLSVRTLHHYDHIGLLTPKLRNLAGARLYVRDDLMRLHRIQALKHLGYSLAEIRTNLDDSTINPQEIMTRQINALHEQARQAIELSERLEYLQAHISNGHETSSQEWLNLLELMTIYKNNLTEDEMKKLRHPTGGIVKEIAAQWTQLVHEVDSAMFENIPADGHEA
jgi:DNA-binding transcriptional MerR regulator